MWRASVVAVLVQCHVGGNCGRNVDTCDTDANRDLTATMPRIPATRFKDKSERSVLLFALYTFCVILLLSALVPMQSAAIPETVLTSFLLRHYKQLSSVCTRSVDSPTVLFARVPCSVPVEPNSDHIEHVTQVYIHILVKLIRSQ